MIDALLSMVVGGLRNPHAEPPRQTSIGAA